MSSPPRRSRLFLIVVFLLACVPGSVAAQYRGADWGLELRHRSDFLGTGDGTTIAAVDTARVSFELYQRAGETRLTYRAAGRLSFSAQEDRARTALGRELVAAPARTGVTLRIPPDGYQSAWIEAEVGRIPLRGPLGVVLAQSEASGTPGVGQLVDGLRASLRWPDWYGTLTLGYTGLLDRSMNRIRMTADEHQALREEDGVLAPRRGIALGRVERRSLLLRQDVGLLLVAQQDFDRSSRRLSSYYGGLYTRGAVTPALRQELMLLTAYSMTDAEPLSGVSLLVHAELGYGLPPSWLGELRGGVRYASGQGPNLAPFPALAGPAVGTVFAEQARDLVAGELAVDGEVTVGTRDGTGELPRLRPQLALRIFGIPSGKPSTVLGIRPSNGFGGIEIAPSLALELDRGSRLSAELGFLLGATDYRSVVSLSGRVSL